MKPIEFPEQNIVYGEGQTEYQPLPAHKTPEGQVVTVWELTDEDIERINNERRIYTSQLTFNNPLQPIHITAIKEDIFE